MGTSVMKIHTHALKTGDRQAIDAFMNSIHPQDAMAAADAMRTSDAVSYTHLDVYKRQMTSR